VLQIKQHSLIMLYILLDTSFILKHTQSDIYLPKRTIVSVK